MPKIKVIDIFFTGNSFVFVIDDKGRVWVYDEGNDKWSQFSLPDEPTLG